MKKYLRIVVVMNLISVLFSFIIGNTNGILTNGFCALTMAILSNDY